MRACVGKSGVGRPADRRPDCRPFHAFEFQGTGHRQNAAAAHDAVKKEALCRAGIGYVGGGQRRYAGGTAGDGAQGGGEIGILSPEMPSRGAIAAAQAWSNG